MKQTYILIALFVLCTAGLLFAQTSYGTREDTFWHTYDNGDAQGTVWWMGDETIAENGSIGGYDSGVYLTLDTPIIQLSGSNSALSFKMRYLFEPPTPNGQWDGFDAFNVRISTNGGLTWTPISGTPAYNISSSYVFGQTYGEGMGIPGYAGNSNGWANASFNLSAYVGQNVKLRFVFASDDNDNTNTESHPDWFGVMIDDISVGNYSNSGVNDGQMTIPNPFTPHEMLVDGNYMWIGAETGLYKMNVTTYQSEAFLPGNSGIPSIICVGLDKDTQGNIWVATFGNGVAKYDGANWTVYNMANSDLPSDIVYKLHVDSSGQVWAACYGGGLAVFDNGDWTTYNTGNSNIPTNMVWCLEIGNDNKVWVGTGGLFGMGVGLAVLDLDDNSWTSYNHENSGLSNNDIMCIKEDSQGRMWIGTAGGVSVFDGTNWTGYNTSNSSLTSNSINSIAFDIDGSTWLGMADWDNGGVAHLSDSNWTIFNQDNSGMISNDCVYSICIDPQGRKWIGTWEGIVIYDGNNWIRPITSIVGVEDMQTPSVSDLLLSSYPNPFLYQTSITYSLHKSAQTELSIYNIRGQLVRKLVNEPFSSGQHTVIWDGKDDNGNSLATGIYLCRISSAGKQETHKMLLMK
ncbi:MAG: two-component regulator propeller domain-containing protein [Candidatus Cloacimonas sp.]|jgi:sugar lactone lactonase YvrE|nr:two-component regulator propeller domain-containing protein [Candidatus Cloacimonas sp.]